ncbi:acetolactate synthase large subunit [Salinifilum ghardaiensis]
MKGSEALLATAHASGVRACFANPGTTEIPLVEAFDESPGVRPVLALAEGVATGAADGYARMAEAPALTLLHLGPGLANGIANLHNARRGLSPVINVIGEHASWHLAADPPLASDIDSLAAPVSGWVGRTSSPAGTARAFLTARERALRLRLPATLIAAADHMAGEGGAVPDVPAPPVRPAVDDERITEVAKRLTGNGETRPALLLGGSALHPAALTAAGRIAAACGGAVFTERGSARVDRTPNLPVTRELPYFPEDVLAALDGCTDLVLVGARTPVSFFGYQGQPSYPLPPETRIHTLAEPTEDATAAVHGLAAATGSESTAPVRADAPELTPPEGTLTAQDVARAIACTQPENAIVVNEGVSGAAAYPAVAASAPPHTELGLTGGAIGGGPPLATGAAVACPERPVITFQADGSAAYSVQALWTQAREGLNVTTVVLANSRYRILETELHRHGVAEPGASARDLTDLTGPAADWTNVARGFGVPAVRVTTGAELVAELRNAQLGAGPRLIEAVLR